MKKITPCLWFDSEAEEAAKYYTASEKAMQALLEMKKIDIQTLEKYNH